MAMAVCCPCCPVPSSSVQSRCQHHLMDLPSGMRPCRLQLTGRKFVGGNPSCPRRIFSKRVTALVAVYARKTHQLVTALQAIGVALGGQAGARLTKRLGLPATRDTRLRLVCRLSLPAVPPLSAIGGDDLAYRKHQRYGTSVVDLEQRRPAALLHNRAADTLAQWLCEHTRVAVIVRDHMNAYRDGPRMGAPRATQVADRSPPCKTPSSKGRLLDTIGKRPRPSPLDDCLLCGVVTDRPLDPVR
jgi:transposase